MIYIVAFVVGYLFCGFYGLIVSEDSYGFQGFTAVLAGFVSLLATVVWKLRRKVNEAEQFRLAVLDEARTVRLRLEALENREFKNKSSEAKTLAATVAPSSVTQSVTPAVAPAAQSVSPPIETTASQVRPDFVPPVVPPPNVSASMGSVSMGERVRSEQPFDQAFAWIVQYFTTGNVIAKIGLVILFFGVTFLIKLASDEGFLPIELRLSAVALGSMALSTIGWRLRERRQRFGVILQGGGLGILYLDIFAAYRLYSLIPPSLAMALLVSTTAFMVLTSLLQNEMSLAVMATAGAFLAPILASTGQGSHVGLFSYFTIVNLGVLAIAYKRSWRWLNIEGFVFTFGLATAWGAKAYVPEFFSSTEPFLIIFFLIYVTVGILFARPSRGQTEAALDGVLVFGTPLLTFFLQSQLVQGVQYGLALSSAALAGFYILLARFTQNREPARDRIVIESFLSIGVVFATLAIPLALTGQWTGSVWALEGAAMVWLGVRLQRRLALAFGLLLELISGLVYVVAYSTVAHTDRFVDTWLLGWIILSLAALVTAYLLMKKDPPKIQDANWPTFGTIYLVGGLLGYFAGILVQFYSSIWLFKNINGHDVTPIAILFVPISAFIMVEISERLNWSELGWIRRLVGPFLLVWLFIVDAPAKAAPHSFIWVVAWLVAVGVALWRARRDENQSDFSPVAMTIEVTTPVIALISLVAWELGGQLMQLEGAAGFWSLLPSVTVPSLFGVLMLERTPKWPFERHARSFLQVIVPCILVWTFFDGLFVNLWESGGTGWITYWPIASAMDLSQIITVLISFRLLIALRENGVLSRENTNKSFAALGLLCLVWMSMMVVRTVHHHLGIPWSDGERISNPIVQMSWSILWSLTAMALMVISSRKVMRLLWIGGASLLGLVVFKLIIVDLAHRGSLQRIVSFIGTGVIVLAIGYFAPIPPSKKSTESEKKEGASV